MMVTILTMIIIDAISEKMMVVQTIVKIVIKMIVTVLRRRI